MRRELQTPIGHMLQGLAHWLSYREEISNIQILEADAVLVATDILRSVLPTGYTLVREATKISCPSLKGKQRVDLAIISGSSYKCLIEFKLSNSTNGGYIRDINKLGKIKSTTSTDDFLVVILYNKSCSILKPIDLVGKNGRALKRRFIQISGTQYKIAVRRVCHSISSVRAEYSKKVICLELC